MKGQFGEVEVRLVVRHPNDPTGSRDEKFSGKRVFTDQMDELVPYMSAVLLDDIRKKIQFNERTRD